MESKNMIGLIIGCVIGIILIGSLLSPVIGAYSTEKLTITNEGMPYAEAGGDHTIVITTDGLTFDGDAVDMSMFPGDFTTYTLVYGEQSFVRYGASNVIIVSDSEGLHSFTVNNNTITITITDNTVVVATSSSATTYTMDDVLFYMSPPGGDYILSLNPYVNEEQTVYAAGDTYYTGAGGRPAPIRVWNIWTGIDGEITVVSCGTSSSAYTGVTVANIAVDYANIESNLYRYNSVMFDYTATATVDDVPTEFPLTATYTYFLAPGTVEYDNPEYIGNDYQTILGAVMILTIVGVLIYAVGFVTRNRD